MRTTIEPRKATLATFFVALMVLAPLATLTLPAPVGAQGVDDPVGGSDDDPVTGPADHGTGDPFWNTLEGFSTKTGYRMVFVWEAAEPIGGLVRWGYAPTALDNLARPVGQALDTSGLAILDVGRGNIGRTVYWEVIDQVGGTVSPINSFRLGNAWNSDHATDGVYTINAVMQLDSESLPDDVPFDQGLVDLARGVDIFAERVWDMTDGHLRIGKVLITDTAAYHPGYQPQTVPVGLRQQCVDSSHDEMALQHTLADFIVTTVLPFDSHTFGGSPPVIDQECTAFYLGRIGQLIVPWEDSAHLGYVMAHEFGHYAMGLPDLYDTVNFTNPAGCANRDPDSPGYDVSVMHNSGGWTGTMWDLTELDRSMGDCDRSVGTQEVSWDEFRSWYPEVPATTAAEIDRDDSDPLLERDNPDGDALDVFLLDQTAGLSTTRHSIAAPRGPGTEPGVTLTSPTDGTEAAPTSLEVTGNVDREGPANADPVGRLVASPRDGDVPLDVTFDLEASDADGSVASWALDFGDGGPATTGSSRPPSQLTHTYTANGTYTATLTVTDDSGAVGSAEAYIIVGNGGPKRLGTDAAGDAPTSGDCGVTIPCDHGWTAAATPGLDLTASYVEDTGAHLRFIWQVSDADAFFLEPSGDPADDPSHVEGYLMRTEFSTSPATSYSIDLRRARGDANLTATLSKVFGADGVGSLSSGDTVPTSPQWSSTNDVFWVDLPKDLIPEFAVVSEIDDLDTFSYVIHTGASVNLIVEKDHVDLIDTDSYRLQSHLDLVGVGSPSMVPPRSAPTTVPADAQIVDATGDVTVAGLPADHMDIEAAWFENDHHHFYAGLKVADIPVDVAATSQVAYHVTFKPTWTEDGWGVPDGATFTGLRVEAVLSQLEFDGIPSVPVPSDGTHKYALQSLYTDTGSRFSTRTDLPLSSLDPDTDIIWFVVPMAAMQSPPPASTIEELGADAVPAVKGAVTFGTALGDAATGNVPHHRLEIHNAPLAAHSDGPYSGVGGTPIAIAGGASGGVAPYTCAWSTSDGGAFDNASACSTTVAFATAGEKRIRLDVTDAEGNATHATTLVTVDTATDERVELSLSGDLLGAAAVHTTGSERAASWTRTVDLSGRSGEHDLTATWRDADGTVLDTTTIRLVVGDGPAAFVAIDTPFRDERVSGVLDVTGRAGHGSDGDGTGQTVAFGPDGLFQDTAFVTRSGSIATFCTTCEGIEQNSTVIENPQLVGSVAWLDATPGSATDGTDGRWLDVSGFVGAAYELAPAQGSPMDVWFFNDPLDAQSAATGSDTGPDLVKTGTLPAGTNWAFVYMRRPTAENATTTVGVNDEALLTLTPPLSAPRAFTGSADWDTVNLAWEAPEWDGGSAIDHYRVHRDGVFLKTVTGTATTDSGLAIDTTYSYAVSAVDDAAEEGPQSAPLSLTTGNDITAPTALTGLAVDSVTDRSVALSWSASADPETGVDHYRIKRDNVPVGTTTTTSYTEAGLREDTTYVYTVTPVNGQGTTGIGSSVDATTALEPVTETVSLYVNSTLVDSVTIATGKESANWSIPWDTRGLDDAAYTLKAVYDDGRGALVVKELDVEVDNIPADPQVRIERPFANSTKETPIRFAGDFTTVGDQSAQPVSLAVEPTLQDWIADPWVRSTLHDPAYDALLQTLAALDGFLTAFPTAQGGTPTIVVLLDGTVPDDAPTTGLGVPVRYVPDVVPEALERPVAEEETGQVLALDEFDEWAAAYSGPATPGIQQGVGPGGAIRMRNIGETGALGTASCTASYLFEDPFTGIYYLATAGHCLMDHGVANSDANPESRSRWVEVCVANCVINYGTSALNTYVRLEPNATYHPVTFAHQGGIGADFGLIEIPEALHDFLRPHMWFWGGPTKMERPTTGDVLAHYGHGLGVGATFATQGRLGVDLTASKAGGIQAAGWVMGGDSGSAVGTAFPRSEELLLGDGASGAITHSIIHVGLPLFWGTDLERGLEMAGRTHLELVTEDAPIRATRDAAFSGSAGPVVFARPDAGATFDPALDGPVTVAGSVDFDEPGAASTHWRTYYLHRSSCGASDVLWMDEKHLASEGGDGCGNLLHPVTPLFEVAFDDPEFVANNYPADPLPDATIDLDPTRPVVAEVYFSDILGTDSPVLLLDYEARLAYNGTIVAEKRAQETVHIDEKVQVEMPVIEHTIPRLAKLEFTFVLHSSSQPLFFNHGGARASNVQLPLAEPRDVAVEVSVGDPSFDPANLLTTNGSADWTASWDISGLPYGKQTLFARALLDGEMLGNFTTRDVFFAEHVPVPPTASFTTVADGLTVDFTDTSTAGDAPVTGWSWDFGDGTTSTSSDPTHTFPAPGTWSVALTATDSDGLSDTTTRNVTVQRNIIEYFVETRLVGPSGEVFGWTEVANAVEGEEGTWERFWAPESAEDGDYTLEARILRGTDLVGTTSTGFSVDNNVAPILAPGGTHMVEENSVLTFEVTATDADGDALTLDATDLPPGATFDDHGNGTGTFEWGPVGGDAGTYTVAFTADDGRLSDATTATVTVFEEALPPVLDPIADGTTAEGETLVVPITGSDLNGDTLSLSVSPLPSGAKVTKDAAGSWAFTWTPGYRQNGAYALTATLSDGIFSVSESFNVTVTDVDVPPHFTSARDTVVLVGVQSVHRVDTQDPDGDAMTLTASGLPSWATFIDDGFGRGTFQMEPPPHESGETYTVTLTAASTHHTTNTTLVLEAFGYMDISLTPNGSSFVTASPGEPKTLGLVIKNHGNAPGWVHFSANAVRAGWTTDVPDDIHLMPEESRTVLFDVIPGPSGSGSSVSFRAVARDFANVDAETQYQVSIPVRFSVVYHSTSAVLGTHATVAASFLNGDPAPGVAMTVTDVHQLGSPFVNVATGTTGGDGTYSFLFDMNSEGGQLPGSHTLHLEGVRDGRADQANEDYSVTV